MADVDIRAAALKVAARTIDTGADPALKTGAKAVYAWASALETAAAAVGIGAAALEVTAGTVDTRAVYT
ncbi:hypothetical protein N7513_008852 [Penicillium frequentans]|nr:hypothetical protein N7513_008852 [Penicillium glabrum]